MWLGFLFFHVVKGDKYYSLRPILQLEKEVLDLIVQYKYESTASTTEDVGESPLEECITTLALVDLAPAVQGVLVELVSTARLHHHTPTHSIEWITDDTSNSGNSLSNSPRNQEWSVLGVGQHSLSSVEESEVRRSVDDNTLDRDSESSVQSNQTVGLEDLAKTVSETSEFTLSSSFADISSQSSTSEIQWVHKAKGSSSSSTSRGQISKEVPHELLILVHSAQEDLLVLVLEGEVQGLSGKVPDHIGQVTTPESKDSLLLGDSDEAVNNSFVLLIRRNLLGDMLDLEEQLDPLDGGDSRLGDGSRDSSSQKVLHKGHRVSESHGGWISCPVKTQRRE